MKLPKQARPVIRNRADINREILGKILPSDRRGVCYDINNNEILWNIRHRGCCSDPRANGWRWMRGDGAMGPLIVCNENIINRQIQV